MATPCIILTRQSMSEISPGRKLATEQRRGSILQAARAVFARQGYANTVVDDIATQAGIAKGTLYLYFPSKEQIYLAALLEEARQLDADSRAAMSSAATWRDKLRRLSASPAGLFRGPPGLPPHLHDRIPRHVHAGKAA